MSCFFRFLMLLLAVLHSPHIFSSTIQTFESNLATELYLNGNYTGALKTWIKLGEKGEAKAQFKLGTIYRLGETGIEKDINKAIKWYTLAAEKGNIYALYNLGKIYESEENIVNYDLASKWYRLGAEKGNAFAQLKLGMLYLSGKGLELNLKYAHMWLNISGSQGNYQAIKKRNILQKKMTGLELKIARLLANKCFKEKYKNCY